jgi:lysophospholipase L1-like esterase
MENGKEIGYIIHFSQSLPITIYHGKDGADGADGKPGSDGQPGAPGQDGENGKDGHTPVIGIKQDTDGKYYWTVDGEWLVDANGNKIPTTGKDGEDGEDGEDGNNGNDGPQGAPGTDGITPQLKIDAGFWYISYDNGNTWIQLGKATGENGAPGKDGDSFFTSVTQDKYYVYLTLSDGTVISLPTEQLIEENKSKTSEVRLAKQYDLVVGDHFQLFYTGVVKTFNIKNEGIRVVCQVGKQMGRYYEYTPTEADAGKKYVLKIETRRLDGSVISHGETVLAVHPKLTDETTPSNLNVLIFGDSLTSGGRWAGEGLRRIYGTDSNIFPAPLGLTNTCTTYGTNSANINGYKVYHEGYGGWTWGKFLEMSTTNPFYDETDAEVDFTYHAAKYDNPGADVVGILLTWNGGNIWGTFNFSSAINKHMTNATTLLRQIHNDFPNAKIVCLGIQISSLNGGTGESYGATGSYSDMYATAFYAFDYNKALEELVTNEEFSEYCYYVDTKGQFDTEYNMPSKEIDVNDRNGSYSEVVGTNGVHPSNKGYDQIGDAFYRALHRVIQAINKSN